MGITAMAAIAISGFKMVTASHIFRSVFGKTPFFCSSTKFAELSNPEIPSIAALNPKNKAIAKEPPSEGLKNLFLN